MILGNVKQKCKERGITLAELERETNIGNGVIARWKSPRVQNVKKVADYFGCTVDDLLREEENESDKQGEE